MAIRSRFAHKTVTIVANTCESARVDVREFAMGQVRLPSMWTPASIGVKVSSVPNTVFLPIYRYVEGLPGPIVLVECTSITVNQVFQLPDEAIGGGFIKLWSQDQGISVNQAADRHLGLAIKK